MQYWMIELFKSIDFRLVMRFLHSVEYSMVKKIFQNFQTTNGYFFQRSDPTRICAGLY